MSVIYMKVTCQYCALEFEEDEIEKHQFECVSSYQNSFINFENKIPCEICNELIDFEKYSDHINICSQPTASIPLLFSRFNTGSANLLNLLNLPTPPVNTDIGNINNINVVENENTDNNEENHNTDNLDNPDNINDNIDESNELEADINHDFSPNQSGDIDYNVNLINYNINLINHLLRNSQFRNNQNVDSYESYTELDSSIVKIGLDMTKVSTVETLDEVTKCPICLDDFEIGSKFRKLKCSHLFCEECLEDWLDENKKCPVCMNELE